MHPLRLSSLAAAVAVALISACPSPTPDPIGPTADFTWAPNCNLVPDVSLSGDASVAGDADISSYFWEFGHDDASAEAQAPDHLFPAAGSYEVSLTVVDANGLADTTTQTLELDSCLALLTSTIIVEGEHARGSAEVENISGYDDAVPSFHMDLLDAEGLVRHEGLDAGQHLIELGATVTVESETVMCGASCGELEDLSLEVIWNGWEPPE